MAGRRTGNSLSYEGALIDGLTTNKVNAGGEREIQQLKDLQLSSWVKETEITPDKSILFTGWARRMKESEVRSRCVLKDFASSVRDDLFARRRGNFFCTQLGTITVWRLETSCAHL